MSDLRIGISQMSHLKVLFSKITVLEGYNITGWTLENAPRTQLTARATVISPRAFCFPETDRHEPCCMAVCSRCRSWVPPTCPPAVPRCCPSPLCSMFLSLLLSYHFQLPLFSLSPFSILPLLKLFNFHLWDTDLGSGPPPDHWFSSHNFFQLCLKLGG